MCFLCGGITELKHIVSSCSAENGYKPGSCYSSLQTKVPPGALCVLAQLCALSFGNL